MSLSNNPGTVRDGLVFYFDSKNTKKSWKGEPTTNLVPSMNLTGMTGLTLTYIGTDTDGWKKYSISGTWNGGSYPYSMSIDGVNFIGGQVYSTGCYIKTNVPSKFGALFTGMQYVNAPKTLNGSSFSVTQPDGSIFVGQTNFSYTSTTSQVGYLNSNPVADGTVFTPSTDFVWIRYGQVESKAYLTPFVAGTRSTNQALVDMTGIHTIPATSLTYASDNTFSFVGSSNNKITGVMPTGYTGTDNTLARSWEVLVKPTASLSTAGIFGHAVGGGCTYYCNGGICIYNGNYTFNWFDNAAYQFLDSGIAATSGVGAHIIGTWDPSDLRTRVYVNGVLRGTFGSATNLNYAGAVNEFQMGYFSGSGNPFTGTIEIAKYYYGKTLNAAEVNQNFNAVRSRYGL